MAIVPPPVTTHSAFLKTLKIKKTLELPVKTNKLKDKLHEMLGISDGQ
jgi:hypothetical protein